MKIGDPVILVSSVLLRLAAGSSIGAGRTTTLVIEKIEHVADNRSGAFESRIKARFREFATIPAV